MTTITLHPWQITGMCDAQQVFLIKKGNTINPVKFTLIFKIIVLVADKHLLFSFNNYFNGIGYISEIKETPWSKRKNKRIILQIRNNRDIQIILLHFCKYPLKTNRSCQYTLAEDLIKIENEDKFRKKLSSILRKENMKNVFSSNQFKDPNIVTTTIDLEPEWIVGFFQFQACFQFTLKKRKTRNTFYILAHPTFQVSFPQHSNTVLYAILNYFGGSVGFIKNKNNISRLIINDETKMIRFFEKYSLTGSKNLSFQDWKKLCGIKQNNVHTNEEGFSEITKIIQGMNKKH